MKNNPTIYYIDLFCGAGGTSTGIHLASPHTKVLACVNHDANAIKSHQENHPDAFHFTEDITDFKVVLKLKKIVDDLRKREPNCIISIWASLECTNFSRAKGGQARDEDSRTLANHMFMYLEEINPDYFWVENVREFMAWGPMYIPEIILKPSIENGLGGLGCSVKIKYVKKHKKWETVAPWKPISNNKGKNYLEWTDKIKSLGFRSDAKILNSANYGAFQTRERLFIQFAKNDLPIVWPDQTHTKDKNKSDLFPMPEWNKVKDILNLKDEGKSIFERKKDLSDKTLMVIHNGIKKALKENESTILYKYYGNGDNLNSVNAPAGTVTCKDRFAKVHLIFNQYKTGNTSSVNKPIGTVTTTPKSSIVSFILNPSHGGHTTSIDKPSPVIIARQDKAPLYLIKALMNEFGILDVKMRMLNIGELKQIQGFPLHYKLIGNQTEQKKFIGNAVEVNQAKALIESNYEALKQYHLKIAA